MTAAQRRAIANHRRRLRRRGIARIEVRVPAGDVTLLRGIAAALADPARADAMRVQLREVRLAPVQGLKALLAAAPLEGIELERSRDTGRDVDL